MKVGAEKLESLGY